MEPDTPFEREKRREEHEVDEKVKHEMDDAKRQVDEDERRMANEGGNVEENIGDQPGGGEESGHS